MSALSETAAETFNAGLKSFVNEGRLLARFDHPSLLRVYRFWEDNGTAYMLMPVLSGMTLKEARLQHSVDETGFASCSKDCWARSRCSTQQGCTTATLRPTTS